MRKRVLILVAAVVLALVLAVPASASKSFPIQGTLEGGFMDGPYFEPRGDRCFVTSHWSNVVSTGSIQGTSEYDYRTLSKGPCTPGPLVSESFHTEGMIKDATVQGWTGTGTIRYRCQGKFYAQEPAHWEGHCTVTQATDGLAGLHATWDTNTPVATWVPSYWGEAHFDPQ